MSLNNVESSKGHEYTLQAIKLARTDDECIPQFQDILSKIQLNVEDKTMNLL